VGIGRRQGSGYALKELSYPKGDVDSVIRLGITRACVSK
jgi:hypothetical protein